MVGEAEAPVHDQLCQSPLGRDLVGAVARGRDCSCDGCVRGGTVRRCGEHRKGCVRVRAGCRDAVGRGHGLHVGGADRLGGRRPGGRSRLRLEGRVRCCLLGGAVGGLLRLVDRLYVPVLHGCLGSGGLGDIVGRGPDGFATGVVRLSQRQFGGHEHSHGACGQHPHHPLLESQDLRCRICLPPQPDEPGQSGQRSTFLPLRLPPHRGVQQTAGCAAHSFDGSGGSGGAVRAGSDSQQFPQRFPCLEVTFVHRPVLACGALQLLQAARHPLDARRAKHCVDAVEDGPQRGQRSQILIQRRAAVHHRSGHLLGGLPGVCEGRLQLAAGCLRVRSLVGPGAVGRRSGHLVRGAGVGNHGPGSLGSCARPVSDGSASLTVARDRRLVLFHRSEGEIRMCLHEGPRRGADSGELSRFLVVGRRSEPVPVRGPGKDMGIGDGGVAPGEHRGPDERRAPPGHGVGNRLAVLREDEGAHLIHHGDGQIFDPAGADVLPRLTPQPGQNILA